MGAADKLSTAGETLADRVRGIARGRSTLDVAKFNFIGLDEVREAYGARWEAQAAKVQDAAETYLRRRLGSSDLLVRAEGGFIAVFGAVSGNEAETATLSLLHGVNEFFLGDANQLPVPRMHAVAQSLPTSGLAEAFGDLAIAEPPAPGLTFGLGDLEWRFQPVWDVKREVLSSWYVAPYIKYTGARMPGYLFEAGSPRAQQFWSVDEASLWVSEQALKTLDDRGKKALVGVSLHILSLTNLTVRAKLFGCIERLDHTLLKYRLFKIAAVPPGFPRMYLNEIVAGLKARLPIVVVGAAWDERDVAGLLHSGADAVGLALTLAVTNPKSPVSPSVVLGRVAEAVRLAHHAKRRLFVEGPLDRDWVIRLRDIGVDNITSPRVWSPFSEPDGMLRWSADHLTEA